MKKKRQRKFIPNALIKVRIYGVLIPVYILNQKKYIELNNEIQLELYGKVSDNDDSVGNSYPVYKNQHGKYVAPIVLLRSSLKHSVISHEIYHAVCMILERAGVKYCDESEECFAYLIGFITKQLYKNLKSKRLKTI